jgi:hypothetical protein
MNRRFITVFGEVRRYGWLVRVDIHARQESRK